MPTPVRYTGGFTQAASWQAYGDIGVEDFAFYANDYDDFFYYSSAVTERWTTTLQNSGTAAATAVDGGNILFTTGVTAGNTNQIQRPTAYIQTDLTTNGGKQTFFKARLKLGDITNSILLCGLAVVAAPVVSGTTQGIYFVKGDTAGTVILRLVNASATVDTAVFTTMVNDTFIELSFQVNRQGDIEAGVAVSGFTPQSGTGSSVSPRFTSVRLTAPTLSTSLLSPFISVASGAAAGAKTATIDYIGMARER